MIITMSEQFSAPLEDSVLRCLIDIKLEGICMPQVTDAIGNGDHFIIVLQWGETEDGKRTPRLFATVPAEAVSAVEGESDFELVSSMGLDLDAAETSDLQSRLNRSFMRP